MASLGVNEGDYLLFGINQPFRFLKFQSTVGFLLVVNAVSIADVIKYALSMSRDALF